MVEVTMRIQRKRFRPAVFYRTEYDGITFPPAASSAEAIAAVSFWVQEPDFGSVRGSVAGRLYMLVTVAEERTGRGVRYFYKVTDAGLQEAFGGLLEERDVSFAWNGFETGTGGDPKQFLKAAAVGA